MLSIMESFLLSQYIPEVNGSYMHASKGEYIPRGFTGKFDDAKVNKGSWQRASVKIHVCSVGSAVLVQESSSLPEGLLSGTRRTLVPLTINISTLLGRKLQNCQNVMRF